MDTKAPQVVSRRSLKWRSGLSWLSLVIALLVGGFSWSLDTHLLLASLTPTSAWVALAVLWLEIGALAWVLIRRYRLKRESLRLGLLVAWVCAGLNIALAIPLWPALVLGF